jgi:hypothetical protein
MISRAAEGELRAKDQSCPLTETVSEDPLIARLTEIGSVTWPESSDLKDIGKVIGGFPPTTSTSRAPSGSRESTRATSFISKTGQSPADEPRRGSVVRLTVMSPVTKARDS